MTTAPTTVSSETDLVAVLRTYNEVTERLKRSHESLAREVCRLREELNEKNKQLQRRERLAGLGEMAAGVAHEIRNPLGGIGLFVSLLQSDLADRPRQLGILGKMSAAIRDLESLVSDILAFAGDAEPNRQRVSAGELLDAVTERTAPKAQALHARIEIDSAILPEVVCCDPAQVERAIVNLVFNALDAAGSGGYVRIRREDRRHDDRFVRMVVEDDGPGIASDLLHRIFNPFFTTKDNGTGLGLAIVHRIAESNGGSVTASNRQGGGAAFVLSLPSVRVTEECAAPASSR
jgi:signal transduction histidine kinase